tara:strand:- start:5216 stop:5938 length:723 start_codon:yes stop_codon:yes gene_type:complete
MKAISQGKLAKWGLLKQVYKDEIIDESINKIKFPKDSEIKIIFDEWLKSNGINSNDGLNHWQKNRGLSRDDLQNFIIRDWRWKMWCREKFEKEIPSYYLKRKPLLDLITYSLLRVKEESLALELYLRINEGEEDFRDLSKTFSEGPESKYGGKIGPVNVKHTHPILAKILLISEKNQLWLPKKIDEWWIIVRLEELINTELNENLAMMLAYELGENYLNNQSDMIHSNFLKGINNIKQNS